jgi:hypothetical protein
MVGRGTLLWEGVEGNGLGAPCRTMAPRHTCPHARISSHKSFALVPPPFWTALHRRIASDRPTIDEVVASQYVLYGRFFLSRRSNLPEFLAAAEFRFHIQSLLIPSAHLD